MSVLLGGLEGNQSGLSSGILGGSQLYAPEVAPMVEMKDQPRPMLLMQMWNLTRFLRFLTGVTKDVSGNPLASCTVYLYVPGSQAWGSVTSDANGVYTFVWMSGNFGSGSGIAGQYQVVARLAGAPNVDGVTDFISPA